MRKLKNAPFVDKQPKGKPFEAYIIAGSEAWDKTRQQIVNEWTKAETGYQAVILGTKELLQIHGLKLPLEVGKVSIFKAGELSQQERTAIYSNLAKHSTAETVVLNDEAMQPLENASEYISRLRTDKDTAKRAEAYAESKQGENNAVALSERPTHKELVRAFLTWFKKPLRVECVTKQAYFSNGIYWETLDDFEIERAVADFLDSVEQDYTDTKLTGITNLLKKRVELLPVANNEITGFQNIALNKRTGELLPLSESLYLRGIEPFTLSQSLETPYFDDWLAFISDGSKEREDVILSALYMILTNRHNWQLFVEVAGIGGSGKSVLGQIATLLNGKANTAFLALEDLESPIYLASLIGKSFNLSADQADYRGTAENLKKLTSFEPVMAKILYSNPKEINVEACYMIITNHALSFRDAQNGIGRRRVIIPFTRKVPPEKRDVDFLDKVKGEIYGITQKLLKRYNANPHKARLTLENYQANSESLAAKANGNHLLEFVKNFEVIEAKGLPWGSNRSKLNNEQAIYNAYLYFADCQNLKPASILPLQSFKQAFKTAIKESTGKELVEMGIGQNRTVTNVKLKHGLSAWEDG